MSGRRWRRLLEALSASGAMLACGCLPPAWLSGAGGTGTGATGIAGPNSAGPACMARPAGGFGPVGQGGPTGTGVAGSPPGPVNLAGYNALGEHQAADLSQKLAELQDENKSLAARLQGLQGLLEERERLTLAARGEVQTATQEVARARQDIARCRQEIASLREHARTADRESQAGLQALVNVLEAMLDREAPRPAEPAKEKDKDTKPAGEKR